MFFAPGDHRQDAERRPGARPDRRPGHDLNPVSDHPRTPVAVEREGRESGTHRRHKALKRISLGVVPGHFLSTYSAVTYILGSFVV